MAITTIPTAEEIKDRIVADLNSTINQNTPDFAKAFNKVLAGAIAGLFVLLYQAITWVYRQIFPDTADEKALELLGALVGITRLSATFAVITATVPGTENTIVTSGTQFRGTSSQVYKVTTAGTVQSSGFATVTLTALVSGESGNIATGSILDIVSPVAGLTGTATVTATTTSGDDKETIDAYRVRVSAAYKKRKTGGSPADYEAWGLETPNFDWISPLDSETLPGDVVVYGKVDNQTGGIPTTSQLAELATYLKSSDPTGTAIRDRHPIGPPLTTVAITRFSFDITISIQDGTTAIESEVTTAVTSYVETQAPYNEAINTVRNDTISEGGISNAANEIANPQGATITSISLTETVSGLSILSYQLFGGEFGAVGTITYVDVT